MGVLRYKDGVTLRPDPAGARLHGALERVARTWPTDLTITAGSDSHGATDPHTLGRGFDVRTHGMTDAQKRALVVTVLLDASGLTPESGIQPFEMAIPGIWLAMATTLWFGQIENHGLDTEHAHVQLRNGRTFP